MNKRHRTSRLAVTIFGLLALGFIVSSSARAQGVDKPLANDEFVRLVFQLPAHPEKKEQVIEEVRRRGINFPLTNGLRSLVATKSGNDAALRRTLEEAERRRVNPTASALPSAEEGQQALARAKEATKTAADAMPDFVVKQIIKRAYARGTTRNWISRDQLTVAVSYRTGLGEQYKMLAVNGLPAVDSGEGNSYEKVGGTSSTGEYVSMLAALFADETQAQFKMVDTDLMRGRRAIVYEFEVKQENSKQTIKAGETDAIISGYRGKIWIDRETYRVLRLEDIATEIPIAFPVTAATSRIDYDWVTITDKQYLLPVRAEIELTAGRGQEELQTRNDIRFRNYQRFGSEVKILEDDGADLPEEKQQ